MQTRSSKSPSEDETSPSKMPSSNKTPSRNKGTQTRGENLNTSWTTDEEAFLVNFLVDRKSEGSSNSVFKDSTFTEVAAVFGSFPMTGAPKNMQSCKSKWGRVRIPFVYVFPVS
jgi:hypothetical protein